PHPHALRSFPTRRSSDLLDVKPRAFGDIGKSAVAIVAVETQGRAPALVAGPVHAIDEQNVLPAVGVVIQKRATRAERLRKQLAADRKSTRLNSSHVAISY